MIAAERIDVDERLRRVDALDLEPVVYKLIHTDPGEECLSLDRADGAIALYRCFLKLRVLYPSAVLVPTTELDRVWHTHMLDTAKYRADCAHIFGAFMDHFPYAGLRGEDDRRAWQQDFERTRELFIRHFDVEIGMKPAASVCSNHGDGSDCCVEPVASAVAKARPRPARNGK